MRETEFEKRLKAALREMLEDMEAGNQPRNPGLVVAARMEMIRQDEAAARTAA